MVGGAWPQAAGLQGVVRTLREAWPLPATGRESCQWSPSSNVLNLGEEFCFSGTLRSFHLTNLHTLVWEIIAFFSGWDNKSISPRARPRYGSEGRCELPPPFISLLTFTSGCFSSSQLPETEPSVRSR